MESVDQTSKLIERIQKGDKAAFSILFRSYYPRIFSFLFRLLKDRELAEEITQDVFFRLWLNREQLNPDLAFDSYIFSIAKNTVINIYKKREVEERYINAHIHTDSFDSLEEQINFKELQQIINQAVMEMPPQQRQIFQLSREQGLQNAEIAAMLSISKRTVEKHISNSLKTLRAVIEKSYLLFFI